MQRPLIFIGILVTPLAGCFADPASRGLAGATAGAVLSETVGGSLLGGALVGGAVGIASCGIELGLPPCDPTY